MFFFRFKLVFVLDLKRMGGKSLVEAIQEQCLGSARKSLHEVHNMIKSHQNEVLILLDGYEVGNFAILEITIKAWIQLRFLGGWGVCEHENPSSNQGYFSTGQSATNDLRIAFLF